MLQAHRDMSRGLGSAHVCFVNLVLCDGVVHIVVGLWAVTESVAEVIVCQAGKAAAARSTVALPQPVGPRWLQLTKALTSATYSGVHSHVSYRALSSSSCQWLVKPLWCRRYKYQRLNDVSVLPH